MDTSYSFLYTYLDSLLSVPNPTSNQLTQFGKTENNIVINFAACIE